MKLLQAAGVPSGIVGTAEDQMEHNPQLKFREFYQERDHPELGRYRPPRQPCVLSKTPGEIKRAPLYGEHNEYAFKEILGMTDDEIAELAVHRYDVRRTRRQVLSQYDDLLTCCGRRGRNEQDGQADNPPH